MPNTITQVTTKGYGQRIMESFIGVILGFGLFFGSFGVLFWNEGRIDLGDFAEKAIVVSPESIDTQKDGMFISVTDTVLSSEDIGDEEYLNKGPYLAVKRNVEKYVWVEEQEQTTRKKFGGAEETTTTYTYKNIWTSVIPDSSLFKNPEGHENTAFIHGAGDYRAKDIVAGAYRVQGEDIDLMGGEELELSEKLVAVPEGGTISGVYLYIREADPTSPKVGDERIIYKVVHEGFVGTVFGKLTGNELVRYTDEDDNTLFRVLNGTHEEAIKTLHSEYTTMLWLVRVAGFFMMWFGLQMLLGVFSTLLDILPFLGGASRFVIGAVTLLAALVLSTITIVISAILHSIVALIVVAVLLVGVLLFLRSRKG